MSGWSKSRPSTGRISTMLAVAAALLLTPAHAVEPSEILDDPVLETRARELSKGLRCLVCRNQSIDDSDASLAKDLRIVVRERLVAGDSDEDVLEFVVDRYGEYVLLKPQFTLGNALLYLGGPLLFLIGGFAFWRMTRKPSDAIETASAPQPLTDDEKRKLDSLIGKRS